jgi:hypothetical protein
VLFEVGIGGGDEAGIDLLSAGAAEAFELSLLLRLRRLRRLGGIRDNRDWFSPLTIPSTRAVSVYLRWPAPPLPARPSLHSSLDLLQFVPTDNAESSQGVVSRFDSNFPKLFDGNIGGAKLHEDLINDLLRFRNDLIGSEKPDAAYDGVKRDCPFNLRVVSVNMAGG